MPELMRSLKAAQQCLHAVGYFDRCQRNERMLPITIIDTSVKEAACAAVVP